MADRYDLVEHSSVPLLRCSQMVSNSEPWLCGSPAPWAGLSGPSGTVAFHCDVHRQLADAPIAAGVVFTQVTLECRIRFAAAPPLDLIARREALHRLENAVRAAGGLLTVASIDAQRCRYTPEWRGRRDLASGDRR